MWQRATCSLPICFARVVDEEFSKLLKASSKDVHDDSKTTTLPIARDIVRTYVGEPVKAPWYVDLLNLNLNNDGHDEARRRIGMYFETFRKDGTRITRNLDF